jgi:hypothetical protein
MQHKRQVGRASLDGHRRAQRPIPHDLRLAADAERVAAAWQQENQPDVRVLQNVAEGIDPAIAEPVGNRQRVFVEDLNEAGRSPFGEMSRMPDAPLVATRTNGDLAMNWRQCSSRCEMTLFRTRSLASPMTARSSASVVITSWKRCPLPFPFGPNISSHGESLLQL